MREIYLKKPTKILVLKTTQGKIEIVIRTNLSKTHAKKSLFLKTQEKSHDFLKGKNLHELLCDVCDLTREEKVGF